MADLTQHQWSQQLENDTNAVIMDVRTQEEVALGVIPKAIHIDILKGQGFMDAIQTLDKNKNYYIYCKAGARSGQACNIMNQLGFNNTYNLMGGMSEWQGDVSEL